MSILITQAEFMAFEKMFRCLIYEQPLLGSPYIEGLGICGENIILL